MDIQTNNENKSESPLNDHTSEEANAITSDDHIPSPPNIQQAEINADDSQHHNKNNSVEIVWQWVTYGLWEWSLIALAALLSSSLTYFFNNTKNTSSYTFIIYILATMLCLLPIAYIANKIYAKKEPLQKQGFAAVVMVINAVGVFLATIGAVIVLVINVLSIFVNADSSTDKKIAIISSLIVIVLGAMLFIRIINAPRFAKFTEYFPKIVVGIATIAVILAIVGPFKASVSSKQDRLIEGDLYDVVSSVQDYATQYHYLPSDLTKLNTSSHPNAKILIDHNLVTYQTLTNAVTLPSNYSSFTTQNTASQALSYQLCVTYKQAKGTGVVSSNSSSSSYLDTSNHPAGKQCYTQTTY